MSSAPTTLSRPAIPVIHRNLMEIVWKHKSLVALGIFVGLVLGGLAYVIWPPVYQSKAQILVVKRRPDIVTGIDTRNLVIEDYVATHKALIESPTIIEQAVRRRNLDQLSCLQGVEFLTESIQKALTVTRNRSAGAANNNSVLDLSFRARRDNEAAIILSAIIESYGDYMEETYRDTSDDTVKLITEARNVLKKDLKEQENAYRAFRKEAPVLLSKNRDGTTLTQERFGAIELKRSGLLVKKAELQGYIDSIDAAIRGEGNREAVLAMAHEWQNKLDGDSYRPDRLSLGNQLLPLLMEEQRLLETRGENHAEVEALRKRIETTREFLASPASPFRKSNGSGAKADPNGVNAGGKFVVQAAIEPDPKDSLKDSLVQRGEFFVQYLTHITATERFFADLYRSEFETARSMTNYEVEDEKFRRDIMLTEKLLDSIVKRLEDVNLVKNVGGYDAKTIAPPMPGKKIHPNGLIVFPVALFLGAIMGCWLAYFAEINDKSFRDVDDVRIRLGLPVVGQIPFLKAPEETPKESGLAPILFSHHYPKSIEAESYRGVRTSLYFNTLNNNHQIVQITSSNVSEGKSTLASNLALSIAQSGKRVLLVDADMRRPTIHTMFALTNNAGLSSVIVDEEEWREVIFSPVRNLSVMTAGPIPPNPADLLTSPRFDALLACLREQYDFVIIDTPPLLAVTDPSIVAHKVDMVIYNVRFTKNARPDAERGRDVLLNLKANVVGVVVNDADALLKNTGYAYSYGYYSESAKSGAKPGKTKAKAEAKAEAKAIAEEPAKP